MLGLRESRGFSLLELVMVLALLAIAVSLIAVNLEGLLPSGRLAAATREVSATIAYARSEAALTGKPTAVRYDAREGRVVALVTEGGRLRESDFGATLPDGVVFDGIAVAGGGAASGKAVTVGFSPTGGGASHVVALKGEDGLVTTIEVHGLTGLVTVHDRRVRLPEPVVDAGRAK